MARYLITVFASLLLVVANGQTVSERAAVRLTATVTNSPASITVNWVPIGSTTSLSVYRKLKSGTSWGSPIATPSSAAVQWVDNSVSVGVNYEYRVVRVSAGATGNGYVSTGINVAPPDFRGKVILLVDNTLASQMTTELNQLVYDMRADGWTVLRTDVSRTASVPSIKSIVQGHYNSDPANVKALYLVGHVPVPYSGNIAPDGHDDGAGARPTDGYYADVNGTWTDNSVNVSSGTYAPSWNIPGDGKFDQSDFPSSVELQVGRVDLYDMPAFASTEVQLMRNYLTKAHNYKIKGWSPTVRGIVIDNLQWVGNPIAASGFRVAPLTGNLDLTPAAPVMPFYWYIDDQSYLWTAHYGGGTQALDGSVITFNGTEGGASTQQLATTVNMGGVFNMALGSYFLDFDNRNNFLRAVIAGGDGLTNCWAGIPAWYFHHMGMGDNIGYSVNQTMNNTGLYLPLTEGWQSSIGRTHLNLMGDPTLRMKMVAPPTNLAVTNSGGNAAFNWTASSETVLGYHIYQFEPNTGVISRLTTDPVVTTSFVSAAIPFIAGRDYMVRAVKLETNFSGSFQNLSLGAIATSAGTASPDCLGIVGGTATIGSACNDNNACTTNDVYSASCQCAGTVSPDTDGDGICNAQDNCPNVAGQIGSSCNDNNACTTNDVLNASCQCAGTAAADTDGDGICNAQDNCPNVAGQIGSPCNDNNACTTNDVLNASCQCAGTAAPDTDGDGVCDTQDNCPNVAGQVGSNCNDHDPCTTNDALNANCQCVGTPVPDTDGDGVCNTQDNCPTVPGQIGSPCIDGDPCTINDVLNANCQCAGTPSGDTDADGVCNALDNCPAVSGQIGSACNDGNACTINDVLNANCNCAGTPVSDTDGDGVCDAQDSCPTVVGQIGSSCNDGNACTTGDVLNANCQCAGTPSGDTDGDGVCNATDNCPTIPGQIGSSCNDGNSATLNDVLNANCVCAGTLVVVDCLGVPNGPAMPGTPCSDGNEHTEDDLWTDDCTCQGTAIVFDCQGMPNGPALPGTACDDNNAGTTNDTWSANCNCAGTPAPLDCLGVPNGSALPGTACNDNNTNTTNDAWSSDCDCVGTPVILDCLGIPNGPALPGTACDDDDVNTTGDTWGSDCTCVGTPVVFDCLGVANGGALPGTTCNDNDPATGNDRWTASCDCVGQLIDCEGVPGGSALPGAPCDDGIPLSIGDSWNSDCTCTGALQSVDCAGMVGGEAFLDDCGTCAGGSTGILPNADVDQDGLIPCEDNCSVAFNPGQADFDDDGVGDACDNCVWVYNPQQPDIDHNGVGDACDMFTGLMEYSATSTFSMYPNPSSGQVMVTCSVKGARTLRFHNALGALVFDAPVRQQLDLEELATGVYMVLVLDAEGRPLAQTRLVRQ